MATLALSTLLLWSCHTSDTGDSSGDSRVVDTESCATECEGEGQVGTILPECACEEPYLLVGDGDANFHALSDGDEVTIVHGPQGGWHVLGSLLAGDTQDVLSIHYTITDVPSGVVVSDNGYRAQLVPGAACEGTYPGMYGFLNVGALVDGACDTPPELLAGHELLMAMEVEDTCGHAVSASVTVIGRPDPADDPECQ